MTNMQRMYLKEIKNLIIDFLLESYDNNYKQIKMSKIPELIHEKTGQHLLYSQYGFEKM